MADDNQDEEQKRLQLEEFQRQQAAAAVEASRDQPNAIPAGRAVDRTLEQTYTARGLPVPSTVVAPTADIGRQPTEQEQKILGIGNYIDQFGDTIHPTHDASGYPNPMPAHAVGVQGVLSPREEQFWNANPNGAVKDRITGSLIGLGDSDLSRQRALQTADISPTGGSGAPMTFGGNGQERTPTIDDFLDPAIESRRGEIANERATVMEHLNTASRQRIRGQGLSPWEIEYKKLQALDHADTVLQHEQFSRAHLKLETVKQNNLIQQRTQDANTEGEMRQFMYGLDPRQYPPGSVQRDQLFREKFGSNPQWLDLLARNKEFAKEVDEHIKGHEDVGLVMQQIQQAGGTVRMTGIGASGKPIYKVEEAGAVPAQVEQRYIRLQASIQQHLEQSDQEKKANVAGKKAGVPYSKAAQLHADQLEATQLEKRYPRLKPQEASTDTAGEPTMIRMRSPDGAEKEVPMNQVGHYIGLGATVVNQ